MMESGAFVGYGEPGCRTAGPFLEAQYLVSLQDFVYESPNNRVLTRDNLSIDISLSLVLKVNKDSDYVVQMTTNVPQINEIIDANIMEKVRGLARTVKARDAYSLRGKDHAKGMHEAMNIALNNKGILVRRVIITSVRLDETVASSM